MTSTTAYLLYLIFALGGAGLYLALPKAGKQQSAAGAVLGVLAVVALLIVLATQVVVPGARWGYFVVFATIAILASARVITHPKPVYSALYFVLVVVAVAALLVLQHAEFLAVALIIIYAGAILVTYLFVIMLAHQAGSQVYDRRSREPFLAVLAGFVLMAAIAGQSERVPRGAFAEPGVPPAFGAVANGGRLMSEGNTSGVGAVVMTNHVVALEVAGLLLLISMIGAIAMSRKKLPAEGFTAPRKPVGQIGKEVEPY
ncbi:MAG: NADH-quinone oxidoreductase subunit J [Phycisphaerae bacterium]|jgi:NADH-quinone oxidoreductase subunit J